MKRVHVLGGLLATLLAAAAVLHSKGYWDTWEDKRAEVVDTIKAKVNESVEGQSADHVKIGMEYAECLGNGAIDAVIAGECPLDSLKPAVPQIKDCAMENPAVAMNIMMVLMSCDQEAVDKLESLPQ